MCTGAVCWPGVNPVEEGGNGEQQEGERGEQSSGLSWTQQSASNGMLHE